MKVLTNEKIIKRNTQIGQYTSLAALLILAGGMIVSFTMREQVYLAFSALISALSSPKSASTLATVGGATRA